MDPTTLKLGRRPAVLPAGALRLSAITATLPAPPVKVGWSLPSLIYPMDGNDTVGDCVLACAAHILELWTSRTGAIVTPSDALVISEYSRLTGYSPGDPSTDNGAVMTDIWTEWQTGGIFGHTIKAWAQVKPASQTEIRDAIWFFGGAVLGLDLPISAQNQDVWDVPASGPRGDGAPGSWGGHCVPAVAANADGVTVVTWGALKRATWAFLQTYAEEAQALLSPDWIAKSGVDPGGVPLASLAHDLGKVGSA